MSRDEQAPRWKVRGRDREAGALGLPESFTITVSAFNEVEAADTARQMRYDTGRENVSIQTITKVGS